jgi:integrase
MSAYGALMAIPQAAPLVRAKVDAGSFASLASIYYGSPQYAQLSASSRRNYRRVIDGFLVTHGHRRVDEMRREHVDSIIGKLAHKPGAAIILLKRIRTLIKYAIALHWRDGDPTLGVKGFRSKEIHTWTEAEITQFEKKWKSGSRERLAFAMLLYTGQRGSDVHRMAWPDIAGGTIRVAQQKQPVKLTIPLHPALAAELARLRRKHIAILVTAYGAQFSVKGFGQFMSAAIREAKLPLRCKAHGLRKAAARRLAEAGCTEKQIGAITGHKTLAEIERYTRDASQERLARQAINKQIENESGKPGRSEMATPLKTKKKN